MNNYINYITLGYNRSKLVHTDDLNDSAASEEFKLYSTVKIQSYSRDKRILICVPILLSPASKKSKELSGMENQSVNGFRFRQRQGPPNTTCSLFDCPGYSDQTLKDSEQSEVRTPNTKNFEKF